MNNQDSGPAEYIEAQVVARTYSSKRLDNRSWLHPENRGERATLDKICIRRCTVPLRPLAGEPFHYIT